MQRQPSGLRKNQGVHDQPPVAQMHSDASDAHSRSIHCFFKSDAGLRHSSLLWRRVKVRPSARREGG